MSPRRLCALLVSLLFLGTPALVWGQVDEGVRPEGIAESASAQDAVALLEQRFSAGIKRDSSLLTAQRETIARLEPIAQAHEVRAEILKGFEQRLRQAKPIAPLGAAVGPQGQVTGLARSARDVAREDERRARVDADRAVTKAAATQARVADADRRLRALRRALGTGGAVENTSGIAGIPTTGWGSPGTRPVTVESLDRYLGSKASPIAGNGRALLRAGAKYDIDPRLIVAIAGAESFFGVVTCAPYNAWGWGCPSGPYRFRSWEEGIDTVARGLRTGYLDEGRTSVTEIHRKYAPLAASNDPNGLNLVWARNVATFLIEQGGDPDDVTGPGREAVRLGVD